MDEESFRRKLGEILGVMDHTAAEQRGQEGDWSEQLRDSVARLHASVDHLRLRVKYLVFDLEATRRENTYLRTMLDRASRGEDGGRGPHE
ncbi:MAG: hypothetical protein ACYTFH_03025 [Planctomycetota bacterium]|jgi:hypothetical protein